MVMVQRDFAGYADKPPHPQWPGNACLALNIVLNYEEGSEASWPDGDGKSELGLTEVHASGSTGRDMAAESMFEYGSRVGIWRLMRLLRERHLPATVFACALALERNPAVAHAIRASGYDVCSHGWRWIEPRELTEAQEGLEIARAVASLRKTTGERPCGWYCRYAPTPNTRRLLVEHGGFLYDSDSYADELPYWTPTQTGGSHLVIPYTQVHNDAKFVRGNMATAENFFVFLRDAFDMLYAEGKEQPRMMSIGLHMRLAGHPGRAAGVARFLDYVLQHDQVWICRRIDIARHWHRLHRPG